MAKWQATVEAPLSYDYGRYTVFKAGPWTQGPVHAAAARAAQGLRPRRRSIRPAPTSSTPWSSAPSSPSPTARPSTAIPKFVDVPMQTLLSDAYNADRRKLVGKPGVAATSGPARSTATAAWSQAAPRPSRRRRADDRAVDRLRRRRADRSAAAARCSGDTVHFDIVDKDGNMVTATPSGGWLQSSPVIPELGFPLGTRGADVLARGGPARHRWRRASGRAPRSRRLAHARRQAVHALGHAGRRPAGPVEHASSSCATVALRQDEPAGGDRRAGLAHRALPALLLAAHRAPRRAGAGRPRAQGHGRGVEAARPQGRGGRPTGPKAV